MNPSFTILLSFGSTPQTLKIFATFISKLFLERYKYSIDTHLELIFVKPIDDHENYERFCYGYPEHYRNSFYFYTTIFSDAITNFYNHSMYLHIPWPPAGISLPSSDSLHPAN